MSSRFLIFSFRVFSHLVGGIEGFKGSSEMLKNYKELKVWQKALDPFWQLFWRRTFI